MVSCIQTASYLMIIARPNQSASWEANVYTLLALAVPTLGIAVLLTSLGAWPVLPFAGLELLALGAALYRVNYRQQYRQVVTFRGDSVDIDKGYRSPEQHWHLARSHTGLTITTPARPWCAPQLCIHDRHAAVTLGEFLTREDGLKLQALLQQQVCVRAQGASVVQAL